VSGHVFHPGHHELHGITVVLRTTDRQVFVGRFDSVDERGVKMMAVSTFDSTRDGNEADFIGRTGKFGVRVDAPRITIQSEMVASITPLTQELGIK
jgi:hypothetical protein